MAQLYYNNKHNIDLKSPFIYYILVRDGDGVEYVYVGKARNESRLREYIRNIDKIQQRRPRSRKQNYRAVHFALAKAVELDLYYEFYPVENTNMLLINQREQANIQAHKCNLNHRPTWSITEYEDMNIGDLLKSIKT